MFKGDAAGKSVSLQEALNQIQGAAIVPMELITPMARLFKQKGLKLADSCLAKIDDVHEWAAGCPQAICHDIRFGANAAKQEATARYESGTWGRDEKGEAGKRMLGCS